MRIHQGCLAVVTGAGSGIGRATAELLAARGSIVSLVDSDAGGLAGTVERIEAGGGRASGYLVDVSDRAAMSGLAAEIESACARVDLLVNNAGVSLAGSVDDLDLDDLEWITGVNFLGMVHGCRFFLPLLRRSSNAWIVNVLSELALFGFAGKAGYCSSKFAARGFSESLSAELRGTSIGLTCVYPGATATALVRSGRATDETMRRREAEFLERRGRRPDDVARRIIRGVERGRRRLVIGPDVWLADVGSRIFPGLTARIAGRAARRLGFG